MDQVRKLVKCPEIQLLKKNYDHNFNNFFAGEVRIKLNSFNCHDVRHYTIVHRDIDLVGAVVVIIPFFFP